jgi:putative pyruvate formate lyase activating enzyme
MSMDLEQAVNSRAESYNRTIKLAKILESCELCPRKCRVNRLRGERGYCRSGSELVISSQGPHFGEEPELVGSNGSGTVFMTNCNLQCVYCQNFEISQLGYGNEVSNAKAVDIMLGLQERGCHNINLVTPTHFAPQLVQAITTARRMGLKVPIIWNCGGYENVEVIKLLEGFVDIYMPDMKYSETMPAERYSNAPDYFVRSKEAVLEMQRQVGDLKVDVRGVAYRGLLIRHLVLPNDLAGSEKILEFITREVSKDCYVNIMAQYRPCGKASEYDELSRRPTRDEYLKVVEGARELGLYRGLREVHTYD